MGDSMFEPCIANDAKLETFHFCYYGPKNVLSYHMSEEGVTRLILVFRLPTMIVMDLVTDLH